MGLGGGNVVPRVRCDGCAQVWLAPGLRPGEEYACKGCGRLVLFHGRESPPVARARGDVPDGGSRVSLDEDER